MLLSLIVSLKTLSKSCLNLTKSRFLITPLFFQHSHPHQEFTFEPILILGPSPKDAEAAQLFHMQEKVQQRCPVRQHPHPSKLHLRDAGNRAFLNYETALGRALSCSSGSLQHHLHHPVSRSSRAIPSCCCCWVLPRSGSAPVCSVELQGQTMAAALPVLFIHSSQMHVLPPTSSRALWSQQGKLFLAKNEREWKIQSHQYFTYAVTTAQELVKKAGAGSVCASHGWECWGCCRLLLSNNLLLKFQMSTHQTGPTRQCARGRSWNVTHGHLQSCNSPLARV